jgi:hypothetical protein
MLSAPTCPFLGDRGQKTCCSCVRIRISQNSSKNDATTASNHTHTHTSIRTHRITAANTKYMYTYICC